MLIHVDFIMLNERYHVAIWHEKHWALFTTLNEYNVCFYKVKPPFNNNRKDSRALPSEGLFLPPWQDYSWVCLLVCNCLNCALPLEELISVYRLCGSPLTVSFSFVLISMAWLLLSTQTSVRGSFGWPI